MNSEFRFMPEQASAAAAATDHVYLYLVVTSTFFTALICILILFFAIRYRRGNQVDRSHAPTHHLGLELLWSVIPLALMMVSFVWGARLYVDAYRPPLDSIEIFIVGKQWMWKVQHANGRREINELHVPSNQPVRLRMISEDVIHSFFIPAFRVKQDVLPGRYTEMWFEPTKLGSYHLFCAEYCGTSHSQMRGQVIVQTPEQYSAWLAESEAEPAAASGQRIFERLRCDHCHQAESLPRGPSLRGLVGRPVSLTTGQSVAADLPYLRRAILDPQAEIVTGYQAIMPSYQGQISEEELLHLIAYLRTLTDESQ